jgi:hypothetical protein
MFRLGLYGVYTGKITIDKLIIVPEMMFSVI